jgi:hypothetical protein
MTMHLPAVVCLIASMPLAACDVSVQERADGKNVDVSTPFANVSVRTDGEPPDTGLPVYPGARLRQKADGPESAVVNVGTPFSEVHVAAATFDSTDAPGPVLEFYRRAMRVYGDVTECRGEIDFKKGGRPVCTPRARAIPVQLAVGTEDHHRMVVVSPRDEGSEIVVTYVQASGS